MATVTIDGVPYNFLANGFQTTQALTGLQNDLSATFEVDLPEGTELQGGDIIGLCKIPRGARVLEWYLDIPALEGAKFELGYTEQEVTVTNAPAGVPPDTAGDPAYFAGADILIAGTSPMSSTQAGVPNSRSLPVDFVGNSVLILTVTTAMGSAAPGKIKGWLRYNMLGEAF